MIYDCGLCQNEAAARNAESGASTALALNGKYTTKQAMSTVMSTLLNSAAQYAYGSFTSSSTNEAAKAVEKVGLNVTGGESDAKPGILIKFGNGYAVVPETDIPLMGEVTIDANGVYTFSNESYMPTILFPVPSDKAMEGIMGTVYRDMDRDNVYEHGGAVSSNGGIFEYGGTGTRSSASVPVNDALVKLDAKKLGASYVVHDHKHSLSSLRGAFFPSDDDFKAGVGAGILVGKGPGYERLLFYNNNKQVLSISNTIWRK